jgi:hypothetical protein
MRWIQAGAIALAVAPWPSSLHGQARLDSLLRFPPQSSIAVLARDFRRGHSPIADNLVGAWRATRHVVTERFLSGRTGLDHVYPDSTGLKFRLAPNDRLEALYAPVGRWTVVQRSGSGDVVFQSDDTADVALFFSCRAIGAAHLICFDLDHIGAGAGDAVVFERLARPPAI